MSLTKDDAKAIAKKLKAEIDTSGAAHDLAQVWYNDKLIASFGIRRGRRNLGHDHIRHSLFISQRKAWELAKCPMSYEDWLERLEELDKLD